MAEQDFTTERRVLQAKRADLVVEAEIYNKPSRFFHPLLDEHLKKLNLLLAQGDYVIPDLEQAVADIYEDRELLIEIQWQGAKQMFSISPEIVSQLRMGPNGPKIKGPPALTVIR